MSRRSLALTLALCAMAPTGARADTPPRVQSVPEITPAPGTQAAPNASILLEITITEQGRAVDPVIIEGLDDETNGRVLDATRAMVFTPAEHEGQPARVRVRFRFRLQSSPPIAPPVVSTPAPPVPTPTPPAPTPTPRTPRTPTPPREGDEQDVTVRGTRPEPGAATREIFRAEELTTVPGTFGEPLRVVASLPGVGRSPLGVGFFLVRGASFENTGFIVDGFPVLNLYHFGAGPSVIASPFVSSVEFEPGNYPLAYGRFSAGLIQVRTDAPRPRKLRAIVEIDLLRASGFISAPIGQTGSLSFAMRRSYYDPFLLAVAPGVFVGYGDAQARFEVDLAPRTRFTVFAFASTDRFTVGPDGPYLASPFRAGLDYAFWRTIARVEHRASRDLRIEFASLIGWDRVEVLQNRRLNMTRTNESSVLQGNVFGQRLTVHTRLSSVHRAHMGFDALGQVYNVTATERSNTVRPTQLTQSNVAFFSEHNFSLDPVQIVTGVRAEYARYASINRWLFDPRLVLRYKMHPWVTAVLGSGLFHQLPNALLMVAGFTLPPQRAWQNSLGVELDLGNVLDARVTGYFNWLFDLPPLGGIAPSIGNPSVDEDLGVDARTAFNYQGRAYGLELFLRRKLERGLYGWVSYTLSRSERFGPNGPVTLFNYDQTHVFNVALSYKVNEHWRLGARFQFASGSPTADVTGGILNSDEGTYDPFATGMTARNPSSNQLDVRVDYTFRWRGLKMNAFLDVINAYNAQNGDLGWAYRYDFAARVPGGGIPLLPTIGLRGEL
ncbi:MAG: TonB-dependent receptor plug domain-containing protein [Deltaproteobacteria bacterium]|nr:TonB-dependent receptor plug domain-containing protein [Deltaproteobacteria bacterium]